MKPAIGDTFATKLVKKWRRAKKATYNFCCCVEQARPMDNYVYTDYNIQCDFIVSHGTFNYANRVNSDMMWNENGTYRVRMPNINNF